MGKVQLKVSLKNLKTTKTQAQPSPFWQNSSRLVFVTKLVLIFRHREGHCLRVLVFFDNSTAPVFHQSLTFWASVRAAWTGAFSQVIFRVQAAE